MNRRLLWKAVAGLTLVAVSACSSPNKEDNTSPTGPSNNTTTSINLAGTWTGTLGNPPVDPNPDRLSWTATQNGTSVTGPAVLTMTGATPSEPDKVVTGTMVGTISGTQVSLTFTLPAGVFAPFGAPAG